MRAIYARMAELEREGRRFAVCTVVRTVGSTPQMVGAKLLVDDLGRLTGTLGGGCVEGDAFEEARRVIDTGDTSLREYELTEDLAWDTGLVCGVTHMRFDPSVLEQVGEPAPAVRRLDGDGEWCTLKFAEDTPELLRPALDPPAQPQRACFIEDRDD